MLKSLKPSYVVGGLIVLNLVLLSVLRFFPYPEIFAYPYLSNLGLLPYKDIIDQHFPGLFFLPINFASFGITSIERARVLQFGLVLVNHLFIYRYFRNLNSSYNHRYLFANAIYAIWSVVIDGHIFWIDSIVSTLILGSLVSLQGKLRSAYIAFFLMGIAVVFKQSTIIFPLIAIFILFKKYRFRDLVRLSVTASIPMIYALIYLSKIGVIREFIYWTVTFNREVYPSLALKTPSTYQLAIITPMVIIGIYVAIKNIITRKDLLISSFFAVSLIFAYPRFELIHLALSVSLGIIIVVQYFAYSRYFHILVVILLSIGVIIYLLNYQHLKVDTPLIEPELIQAIDKLSEDKEIIYAYSIDPRIYKLTNTTPALPFFIHLPWYLVELEDRMVVNLANSKPKLVVRDTAASLDGRKISENTISIDKYVEDNYRAVYTNGSIEILEKNE